ncbi:putative flagellar associated protein [Gregarina niphandrodes]|uniref:Flagellar associated protein n=1 Tax=Gregarina niphandrodes TaxID=110365 RepID=A0A023B2D9_GRENI|nr:putative flagellar associated protein [Gregarina niphandrodes]EZG52968.1 putative flagellar associated protein [Gregarina niphandrodes]|eukprot:XP_011131878.1 putative flagellar associated protein [Gregarina niphandrodes]
MTKEDNLRLEVDPECVERYFVAPSSDDRLVLDGDGRRVPASPAEFLKYVREQCGELVDGYAPFCKHLFVPCPYSLLPSSVPIEYTAARTRVHPDGGPGSGDKLLPVYTDYVARRTSELPVLVRYVKAEDVLGQCCRAKFIDCILYSRVQMIKEYEAMHMDPAQLPDCDWLVISLKYQNENHETPMQPITMLRNTLIEEGGSGVSLDREKYAQSVAYWKEHIEVL